MPWVRLIWLASVLLVLPACQRRAAVPAATNAPPASPSVAAAALPSTLLFDLAQTMLDFDMLKRAGVILSDLGMVRLLEFTKAGEGLSYVGGVLPTGRVARTLLVTMRTEQPAPSRLVAYGVAGEPGRKCALGINHVVVPFFWGYAADVTCPDTVNLGCWTCLAATYDGRVLTLYLNGTPVQSAAVALDTPATDLLIGENFVGIVSDVRIWGSALDDSQIAAASAGSLELLQ